jgi:hypothetical protein
VHCENQPMGKMCGYGPSGPAPTFAGAHFANARASKGNCGLYSGINLQEEAMGVTAMSKGSLPAWI